MGKPGVNDVLQVKSDEERDQIIYQAGFIPGWIGEGGLRPEPNHDFNAGCWRWKDGRQLLSLAAKSINPRVAERRNIRMANTAGEKRTSLNTIHTSYQMVAPNEFARAHRHTVNAGRFILESNSAFTTLDGEKIYMEANDIILTPNWVWHGLGNDSDLDPAFWIDFLDDPLVSALKTIFFEVRDENYSDMKMNKSSPFHIRWNDVNKLLDKAILEQHGQYGYRVKLETPSIPSMDLYMERFDPSMKAVPIKSTANHLFICAEGAGSTEIEEDYFSWERGDVVAVPSWKSFSHHASVNSTLLEITDRPLIEMLGWYRVGNKNL
jgi:gentisate 1,2-dioxygenase